MESITEVEGKRVCRSCGIEQSITNFHRNSQCQLGRLWKCKSCAKVIGHELYARDKKKHQEKCVSWRSRNKERYLKSLRDNYKRKHPEEQPRRKPVTEYIEYVCWLEMRKRCNNPNVFGYEFYGGRGITVCAEWQSDFHRFLADMGPRPSRNYSLDRIDSNGNYEPSNCRWATKQEQAQNRRPRNKT